MHETYELSNTFGVVASGREHERFGLLHQGRQRNGWPKVQGGAQMERRFASERRWHTEDLVECRRRRPE